MKVFMTDDDCVLVCVGALENWLENNKTTGILQRFLYEVMNYECMYQVGDENKKV